ncbi:hypothetical protein ACG7TL_000308 [Trametes sanguinea]
MASKTLSDDSDEILRLQGVSWFTRKAIGMATVYLDIKHYKDENGIEHIDIDQSVTGGIKGTSEYRALDWEERPHEDHVFGAVLSKSKRVPLAEVEREWMKKDWLEESLEDDQIIFTCAKADPSKNKQKCPQSRFVLESEIRPCRLLMATPRQTWGFELVNGEKRYTRHIFFEGPKDEIIEIRLVYDYPCGPLLSSPPNSTITPSFDHSHQIPMEPDDGPEPPPLRSGSPMLRTKSFPVVSGVMLMLSARLTPSLSTGKGTRLRMIGDMG